MRKLITIISLVLSALFVFADNTKFALSGRVKDAVTKFDLNKAKVFVYDSIGEVCDSVHVFKSFGFLFQSERRRS